MNRINLVILLDRLEELLASSPRVPVVGRGLVEIEEAVELLQKIRATVPEEIKRAEKISNDRERVMQSSKEHAERIVTEAEEYAHKLVSESSIVKEARAEAEKILADAQQKAEELEQGANQYANDVLHKLEQYLQNTLKVVNNGKETLAR